MTRENSAPVAFDVFDADLYISIEEQTMNWTANAKEWYRSYDLGEILEAVTENRRLSPIANRKQVAERQADI